MPRTTEPPACRLYRRTGQAVVTLNGRDHYLGKYGTKVSRNTYDRLVGEWLTGGRSLPAKDAPLTITELIAKFWRHAERYYRKADVTPTTEPALPTCLAAAQGHVWPHGRDRVRAVGFECRAATNDR